MAAFDAWGNPTAPTEALSFALRVSCPAANPSAMECEFSGQGVATVSGEHRTALLLPGASAPLGLKGGAGLHRVGCRETAAQSANLDVPYAAGLTAQQASSGKGLKLVLRCTAASAATEAAIKAAQPMQELRSASLGLMSAGCVLGRHSPHLACELSALPKGAAAV